ncbi:MAG: hypothetical protein BM561_05985, partial [Vibrio sp. MedPE-SWchi]
MSEQSETSLNQSQEISEDVDAGSDELQEHTATEELADVQSELESLDDLDLDDIELPSFTEEDALAESLDEEELPEIQEASLEQPLETSEVSDVDTEEPQESVATDEFADIQSELESLDGLDLDDIELPSFTEEGALAESLDEEELPETQEASLEQPQETSEASGVDTEEPQGSVATDELADIQSELESLDDLDLDDIELPSFTE